MNQYIHPQLWVSQTTKTIGLRLIKELNIQKANGLALFLDVNSCFDDQQATLIWIEHFLNESEDLVHYDDIKHAFMQKFPESLFSTCF